MDKNIVIIGAGYAGILTAKKLAKRLKKIKDIKITLIDRNPFHTMLTELHEVAANRVDEDSVKINLNKVFAGRKVNVKLDTVESIDFDNKLVSGANEKFSYDYLVLAAGSKPTFFGIPGVDEFSFKLWSYQDAVKLREHILNSFRKAACETDPDEKKKLLSFFVVGAGLTGVEMVGELAEYIPVLCEKYDIDRRLVNISNIDVLPRITPLLPEKLSEKIGKRLNKMGVSVMLNTCVSSVGSDYIETKCNDVVTKYETKTIIWTAGIESAEITSKAAERLQSANRGRIKVDPFLRSLDNDRVYVAGDNMLYTPNGEKTSVPQMVENCEQSSSVVARNIICAVTGKGEMKEYKPSFHGVMVSVGGRYGVAHVGLPKMMFNLPSFLAMLAKHFINVIYFAQVLGWNKIFSYLKHEFFTIRNRRSFLGGHFSNRTPSFLLVPLRVWLGAVWLFEGVIKINEGWLKSPKLVGFFNGANAWFSSIINKVADATQAVESTTGATGTSPDVAEKIGTVILNFNFLGIFRVIFVCGRKLAESTINDYAFKLDVPLMNWVIDKFIIPNDSVQIFMQIFIVVAEILIGLALMGGLLTSYASAFSLLLQFMFVCTTGLYLGTFWMIFAAIAVLIGAGRTLGLDYYAMPVIKKWWKRLPLIRRLYLYND